MKAASRVDLATISPSMCQRISATVNGNPEHFCAELERRRQQSQRDQEKNNALAMNGTARSRQQERESDRLGGNGGGGGGDVIGGGIKGGGGGGGGGNAVSEFASVQEIDRKMDILLGAQEDALQTVLHHELEIKRLYWLKQRTTS
ncbi:hypothetical protein CH63R_14568 [Colletotrichum higginsianum IMI 349063]|uniref:Uncharacterized protein n=1 Tax=Colletotrichum higginsianum (strain IMI 349063) TaxID=759273 RepID=A0A1B7XQF1_COLHI|nr:hypothetical protein CH63R_14568 [Colletotrichum higginsianum IMI 349063]OBR01996.1 hypothetical protein CH63R_14568 [Colletotrichum higginsianum IMI 349063]